MTPVPNTSQRRDNRVLGRDSVLHRCPLKVEWSLLDPRLAQRVNLLGGDVSPPERAGNRLCHREVGLATKVLGLELRWIRGIRELLALRRLVPWRVLRVDTDVVLPERGLDDPDAAPGQLKRRGA